MFRGSFFRAAFLAATALLVLLVAGCGKKAGGLLIPNERPSVDLTSAPTNSTDKYFYAYRLDWSGNDPDGKVDYYLYAIDPPTPAQVALGQDTTWIKTTKNEQIVFFRATKPDSGGGARNTASDFHVFVIKAIDNGGLASVPKFRAFFAYTVAPTVLIVNPQPSGLLSALVTPAVRISWTGQDPDGQFTQKPVKYKYKLLKQNDPEFDIELAKQDPDSLRRFYAARAWAGWDSTSAETTQVQFTNLTPNSQFLFVLIGFDEAGAYSPVFSLNSNMLQFSVGFAGTLGPVFTVYNEFFFYQYSSGGYTPNDPLSWIKVEVPADRLITFNWFADPPPGATIEYYRWMLDGDVTDETPRSNENTDLKHWSQKSPGTLQCVIGPFDPAQGDHFLYVEAKDNNDLKSLAVVRFSPVRPTFAKKLLIVDDTRLEVDKFQANGCPRRYTTNWPAAAELDTFLYARGGVPWRCTIKAPATQPAPNNGDITRPGVFAGYSFDTLGTRLGYELASSGTPLSKLGEYQNVIWMVDSRGAQIQLTNSPTASVDPVTTLRWMSAPGRSSTLSAYVFSGGRVWMLGGGSAFASLFEFNARGSKDNDKLYSLSQTVFSNSNNELIPGRIMYDGAHWQNEMIVQQTPTQIFKSPAAVGGWSNPGRGFIGTINAPNYALLPAQMRLKDITLGDSLPPTRGSSQSNTFYLTGAQDLEYLDQPNQIIEDIDPDPLVTNEVSVLDSLFELTPSSALATSKTGYRPVVMTYYHGTQGPQFIFSGFNLWSYSRQDIIGLVDFVLQQIWGLSRSPVDRGAAYNAANMRPGAQPARVLTPAQRSLNSRLPIGRTRE